MSKNYWDRFSNWEEAEKSWDQEAALAETSKPIQKLKVLPNIPGIEAKTKKYLKWKSLKWMVKKDEGFRILRRVLRNPFSYGYRYIKSLFSRQSFERDGDFYLYGLKNVDEFVRLMGRDDVVLVVGFSYCEKPHECPSGRFTPECVRDLENPVCRQCFIGKSLHTLPQKKTIPLIIPTIHYIGNQIFDAMDAHPGKQVIFLITACEMTLEMFGDYGNMAGVQGVGVRLDGRICNTMRAFELSEDGIKPGLTVLTKPTEKRVLELLATWRSLQTQS